VEGGGYLFPNPKVLEKLWSNRGNGMVCVGKGSGGPEKLLYQIGKANWINQKDVMKKSCSRWLGEKFEKIHAIVSKFDVSRVG